MRAVQELSHVQNPQAFAELQRRFAREYIAALRHGTMSPVNALKPDAQRTQARAESITVAVAPTEQQEPFLGVR
jgi:hypothetical protein